MLLLVVLMHHQHRLRRPTLLQFPGSRSWWLKSHQSQMQLTFQLTPTLKLQESIVSRAVAKSSPKQLFGLATATQYTFKILGQQFECTFSRHSCWKPKGLIKRTHENTWSKLKQVNDVLFLFSKPSEHRLVDTLSFMPECAAPNWGCRDFGPSQVLRC